MTSRTFVGATLGLAALLALGFAAFNIWVDFYGLYGDDRGQERVIASNDRFGKYLMAINHVPSNYDALLVGSSISVNLNPVVPGRRLYNLSISAGNITDEALLLDAALDHGSFALVVFCLNPYLVRDTAQKAGPLGPRDRWSALGSLPLVEDYAVRIGEDLGLFPRRFTAWGGETLAPVDPSALDGERAHRRLAATLSADRYAQFPIDDAAVRQLQASIERSRASGARVVAFFPPAYDGRYSAFREAYRGFDDRMRPLFRADELVIDFNDGRLREVTADPASFRGTVHYSPDGVAALDRALATALSGPASP